MEAVTDSAIDRKLGTIDLEAHGYPKVLVHEFDELVDQKKQNLALIYTTSLSSLNATGGYSDIEVEIGDIQQGMVDDLEADLDEVFISWTDDLDAANAAGAANFDVDRDDFRRNYLKPLQEAGISNSAYESILEDAIDRNFYSSSFLNTEDRNFGPLPLGAGSKRLENYYKIKNDFYHYLYKYTGDYATATSLAGTEKAYIEDVITELERAMQVAYSTGNNFRDLWGLLATVNYHEIDWPACEAKIQALTKPSGAAPTAVVAPLPVNPSAAARPSRRSSLPKVLRAPLTAIPSFEIADTDLDANKKPDLLWSEYREHVEDSIEAQFNLLEAEAANLDLEETNVPGPWQALMLKLGRDKATDNAQKLLESLVQNRRAALNADIRNELDKAEKQYKAIVATCPPLPGPPETVNPIFAPTVNGFFELTNTNYEDEVREIGEIYDDLNDFNEKGEIPVTDYSDIVSRLVMSNADIPTPESAIDKNIGILWDQAKEIEKEIYDLSKAVSFLEEKEGWFNGPFDRIDKWRKDYKKNQDLLKAKKTVLEGLLLQISALSQTPKSQQYQNQYKEYLDAKTAELLDQKGKKVDFSQAASEYYTFLDEDRDKKNYPQPRWTQGRLEQRYQEEVDDVLGLYEVPTHGTGKGMKRVSKRFYGDYAAAEKMDDQAAIDFMGDRYEAIYTDVSQSEYSLDLKTMMMEERFALETRFFERKQDFWVKMDGHIKSGNLKKKYVQDMGAFEQQLHEDCIGLDISAEDQFAIYDRVLEMITDRMVQDKKIKPRHVRNLLKAEFPYVDPNGFHSVEHTLKKLA